MISLLVAGRDNCNTCNQLCAIASMGQCNAQQPLQTTQHNSIPDFGAGLPQQGMLAGLGGSVGDVHPAQSLRLNLAPPWAIHHAPSLQGPSWLLNTA